MSHWRECKLAWPSDTIIYLLKSLKSYLQHRLQPRMYNSSLIHCDLKWEQYSCFGRQFSRLFLKCSLRWFVNLCFQKEQHSTVSSSQSVGLQLDKSRSSSASKEWINWRNSTPQHHFVMRKNNPVEKKMDVLVNETWMTPLCCMKEGRCTAYYTTYVCDLMERVNYRHSEQA